MPLYPEMVMRMQVPGELSARRRSAGQVQPDLHVHPVTPRETCCRLRMRLRTRESPP